MIVFDFIEKMKPFGIFSVSDIEKMYPGLDKRRLFEWQSKGYILKLRNTWYCLPGFLDDPYSTWLTANLVHGPSYISLETALAYHDVIPEGVFMTTSVTTNRPLRLEIHGHTYSYSSLRNDLFTGYLLLETSMNKRKVRIANLEKAIVDFFYFRTEYATYASIKELRFSEPVLREYLDMARIENYLEAAQNKALADRVRIMMKIFYHAAS
jgi:predicted transcriptional regulator of viral defense system